MSPGGPGHRAARRSAVKVIAVVGSASDSGKTRVACAILRALPGLGAVKMSPREGPSRIEWGAGQPGKDTERYAQSGAGAVARIVAPRDRLPEVWREMSGAFAGLPGIVVEGAGALDCAAERFTVFVAAPGTLGERSERDGRLAAAADWLVVVRPRAASGVAEHPLIECLRGRIPVLSVEADQSTWEVETLVAAIRGFLSLEKGAEVSRGGVG
jgi:hypothetical protein